ncbi:MAG: glycosyltransferase [Synechococcales bacterium]|nr:glycosyltransferase [Synechococcales bacterium]
MSHRSLDRDRIAVFIPTLNGGGAERVAVNMLKGLIHRNIQADLVVGTAQGPYLNQVPSAARLVDLQAGRVIKSILPLARYLKETHPFALLCHMSHTNVAAVAAHRLAQVQTRLVLIEQVHASRSVSPLWRSHLVPIFMRWLYPQADAVVGVSEGVAQDLQTMLGLTDVKAIYSPIVDFQSLQTASNPPDHPWFQPGQPPVFLAVGRLDPQKDFVTLIRAFAQVQAKIPARLMILGEGSERQSLETLIQSLGLTDAIALPGFASNPFAYMSHAAAFVLSSRWEGLPTVLVEALACGCPVISTDCPSGPEEILEQGRFGPLVPMGDVNALANAMVSVLSQPLPKQLLIERAQRFSIHRAMEDYLDLIGYSAPTLKVA